jgi:hypothetical protein
VPRCLADALRRRGVEVRSPGSWQPQFDLAFEHAGKCFVVEVKSGDPVSTQQVRLGVGQLLEYRHLLRDTDTVLQEMHTVLLVEAEPPHPWGALAVALGIQLLRADQFEESLPALLAGAHRPARPATRSRQAPGAHSTAGSTARHRDFGPPVGPPAEKVACKAVPGPHRKPLICRDL